MDIKTAVQNSWQRLGMPETIDFKEMRQVQDILAHSVRHYGDLPAFTCLGNTTTFNTLDHLSDTFAAWLQQHSGLEPGDRVAIQMPNLTQYAAVAFGVFKAGMVVVNVNPMYTRRELEYQLNHSHAKVVVVFDQFLKTLESALPNTPVEKVVVCSPFDVHPGWKRVLFNVVLAAKGKKVDIGQHVSLHEIFARTGMVRTELTNISSESVAVLQYTGGTTGVSKPAMLTHHNLLANMFQGCGLIVEGGVNKGDDLMVSPLPMYHIYAFTLSITVGIYLGLNDVLIPDPRDTNGFIKQLKKWPPNFLSGLNTLFLSLLNHPQFSEIDWSKLRLVTSGGMALTEGVATQWLNKTGVNISEGYGMTETSPAITFSPPQDIRFGSVGVALPCTEIRVVDEQGCDRKVGEDGELWVRGPQVMAGYWNFEAETSNVITDDGWLKTGDIVNVDEDGYVRILDRQKDMVVVSGFNVYPNEIEGILSTHPDITHCAVIGVSDKDSGEAIKVFVVSTNPKLTSEEVRLFCKNELAGYKVPKFVEFRDELPLSNVGKVLRKELRET